VILMTPSLLQKLFHIVPRDAQMANLAGTAMLCISTVLIGAATDRFGIRRIALPALLFLIAATYGLYVGAASMPSALLPLYALAGIGAGGVVVLTPVLMIQVFPAPVRFSGVSFSYNIAYAIFGGITPLLVSWLAHLSRFGPAHYVAAVSVVGLVAMFVASTPSKGQDG